VGDLVLIFGFQLDEGVMTTNRYRLNYFNLLLAGCLFISLEPTITFAQAGSEAPRQRWLTPACARHDLLTLATIEERGERPDTPPQRLGEAGLRQLEARLLCLSGDEEKAVALYESIFAPDTRGSNPATSDRVRR
jgi:hypothetical protein